MVVLLFHILLLSPALNDPAPGLRPAEPSWWLTHTPLHVLWAGPQAVFLFFVLSGFVLALPATRAQVHWRAYYPQRLIRLYLPVWGSLLLAGALTVLVPRRPHDGPSGWYLSHVEDVGVGDLVHDGLLLLGTGWTNSPLWSLKWEVLFSLLLPLYVVFARWRREAWLLKLVVLLGLVAAADLVYVPELLFLSMFALGVLLAFERESVAAAASWVSCRDLGWAVAVSCLLLLSLEAGLVVLGIDGGVVHALAVASQMVGACLAVVLALHWEPARRRLSSPWAQWIGVRSFSLYLVHEPLAVSSAALWPGLPVAGHVAIVVPTALLVAHLFHRAVEAPAHRLARSAARRSSARGEGQGPGHGSLTAARSAA